MSFLTKSVNYSETNLLKTKILAPLLKKYNESFLTIKDEHPDNYIIPNNDIKYYLLITKKNLIETNKGNFNILYFFPDKNNTTTSEDDDFYLEIDNTFDENYLLEGYIYNKRHFLLTDILVKDNNIITFDYNLRYTILNEFIYNYPILKDINNVFSINLHNVFNID